MVRQISLHPSDVAVALDLTASPSGGESGDLGYRQLGFRVGVSHGEAHNAVKRLRAARLVSSDSLAVAASSLFEFVVHGVQYAFPAILGAPVKGVPTATAAPLMQEGFSGEPEVFVWPSARGAVRGTSVAPLIPSAPDLLSSNTALYDLLALVDVMRVGRARERRRAEQLLRERIIGQDSKPSHA